MSSQVNENETNAVQWRPLTKNQRRVLGTLMEKSKTTPDAYPMTISALTTGCNQKTNRAPITNYNSDQVEKTIDELRVMGALTIVQGSGRVEKIRHYAYQWLGISKLEAAVMTELLLRGEQTLGDLRGRAARMEPIADLGELSGIFKGLLERNLVVELTPPGRGQLVSHNLYEEWELNLLRQEIANNGGSIAEDDSEDASPSRSAMATTNRIETTGSNSSQNETMAALQSELADLREIVADMRQRLTHLESELGITK